MPSTCTIYHDAICPPGFRCAIPLDGDRAGSCLANGEKAPYPEKREPSTMIPPPSTWTGAPRYLPVPTSHSDGDYPSCIRPTYPCVATPTGSGVSGSGTGLPNPGGKKQPCGSRGHQPCPSGYRCAMYAINQFVADTGGQCVRVGEKPAFAELQTGPLGRPGGGLAAAKGSGEQNED
jgi:hypothetical protein